MRTRGRTGAARRAAVGAATVTLLAACGGGTGSGSSPAVVTVTRSAPPTATTPGTTAPAPTTAPTTTSTGAQAAPTTTASAPATSQAPARDHARTRRLTVTPRRGDGWEVKDEDGSLSCGAEPSPAGVGKDTHSCGATAGQTHACVPDGASGALLCAVDPWSKQARRVMVDGDLPMTAPTPDPRPLGVELADGSRWLMRNGGALGESSDRGFVLYYCSTGCRDEEVLVTGPDGSGPDFLRDGDTWLARRGETGEPPLPATRKEPVAKVWFLAAAPRGEEPSGSRSSDDAGAGSTTVPVTIRTAADARRLPDVGNLRRFAASQLQEFASCGSGLTIQKTDWRTTALLHNRCDSAMIIWGVKDGRWGQVFGGMDGPFCRNLRESGYDLDMSIAGPCEPDPG